jgi:low temperature requirement protein LtrA
MIQVATRTELNPVFNYGVTAGLFFWLMRTEKEPAKKKAARNMGVVIGILAFLAFLGGF